MTGWYIGAIINVVGSILINLGTNVMKLGHNKRSADLPESSRRPIRKYREWQCGVGLFVVGNALNFISFGFAAQSLLAALGSIQFVSNVFFAWFVLHERADRRVIVATAMIVVGCIVLVAFGNHQSKPLTSRQLQHLFQNDIYIAYLSWLLATAGLAYIVYRIGTQKLKREGLGGMSHRWMKALPISYSLFSGMIGTQSVLFSKALSTLLRTTIDGHSQLGTWFFWLVLVLFLCCAYFWVTSLNKALRLFPAVVIVPTMQISWTLFSVVSGGIYYQEYHAFTAFTASMFGLGVLIIFVGVYLLSGGSAHDQITPCPLPECPDAPCDPESLCVSQQHISRTSSVLALPGFGYMPDFLSEPFDCQLAPFRYIGLNDQSDLTLNGVTRYNSSKGQQRACVYLVSVGVFTFHQGSGLRTLAIDLWSSSPLSLLNTVPADAIAERCLTGSVAV
ncbi:hypothetical protein WJX79_001421 [Trebouxia sp. C0005]